MYETLEDMKEQGYVVDKLTPTHSKNDIVWDSENNQFVLVYENGETYTGTTVDPTTSKSKMWKVYTEIPTSSEYSIYLAGTNLTGTVEVNGIGFDAGENTGVTVVSYKNTTGNANDVVIRTTGSTNLNIDAESDTINHYGEASNVNIENCAMHSYYENGEVTTLTVEKGHVELTQTAKVNSLIVEESNKSNVKLSAQEGVTLVNAILPSDVEGAEQIESKAENKIEVSSEYLNVTSAEQLNKILLNQNEDGSQKLNKIYIRLGSDIQTSSSISIAPYGGNVDVTIDGNGHKITSSHARVLQTCEKTNPYTGTLTITNLTIECTNSTPGSFSNTRGISLWEFKGVLNFLNSKVVMETGCDSYGIRFAGTVAGVLNLKNSSVSAYQGIVVSVTAKSTVNIDNCNLTTFNTHNTQYFGGAIAIMENTNATVVVSNTKFKVEKTSGCITNPAIQVGSALGSENSGMLKIDNCKIEENAIKISDIKTSKNIVITIDGTVVSNN